MVSYYDELEIEDFVWDEVAKVYHYPCPCGDRFEISKSQLKNGEEIATCPSCSLIVRVIYDQLDYEDYESEEGEEEEEEEEAEEEEEEEEDDEDVFESADEGEMIPTTGASPKSITSNQTQIQPITPPDSILVVQAPGPGATSGGSNGVNRLVDQLESLRIQKGDDVESVEETRGEKR